MTMTMTMTKNKIQIRSLNDMIMKKNINAINHALNQDETPFLEMLTNFLFMAVGEKKFG